MIQKMKTLMMVALASATLLTPALVMSVASTDTASAATITENFCAGSGAASGENCGSNSGDPDSTLTNLAQTVTRWFSIIVGAISIIMIIYGGFRYITSGGDSGKVGAAKNTLIYAIVGLIVVALAQVIVNFVLTQSTDAVK